MRIVEFDWLKRHQGELRSEDRERLEKLGIFKILETGEVNMSAGKFVVIMREVIDVVEMYRDA